MNIRNIFLWGGLVAMVAATALANQQDARDGGHRFSREQLFVIRQSANRLTNEMEHLQEDIRTELRGWEGRRFYGEADSALSRVLRFERTVNRNTDRRQIYRAFDEMDRQLHRFLERLRTSTERGALQRGISRVNYADQQLHYAIFGEGGSPHQRKESIARQAHALESESREFFRIAEYVLQDRRGDRRLLDAIEQYADEAAHFREGNERRADRKHVARDFRSLDESWQRVVGQLNESGYGDFLRRQADRVNTIHRNLRRLLGVDTASPQVRYRFERGPDFRLEITPEN